MIGLDHVHLQWFGDPPPDPAPGEPAPGPDPQPPAGPEPLSADGTFLAQAPDKYKRDQAKLKDLLPLKSWGAVLDRLYASESQLEEHRTKATELEARLTAEQARAAELEKGGDHAPAPQFTAEQYGKIKAPKLPDSMASEFPEYTKDLSVYVADAAREIAAAAQELGISPAAAQRFADLFAARHLAAFEAGQREYARQREAGLKALKETWRGDFEARQEVSRRAIMTFGGEDLVKHLALRGLENDAVVVRTFEKIGRLIGEGHLVPGRPARSPGAAAAGTSDREAAAAASARRRYPNSPELTGGR